jgi:hypothetical protein
LSSWYCVLFDIRLKILYAGKMAPSKPHFGC